MSSSNDDVMVNESEVQSSETGAGAQVVELAVAESAKPELEEGVVDAKTTMETTSSESKEHHVADEDIPADGAANDKTKSSEQLDMIRMTLYGSRHRLPAAGKRRSHTVINRHVSLRVPRPNMSHDTAADDGRLSGSTSMYQITTSADVTESLPPSRWPARKCSIFSLSLSLSLSQFLLSSHSLPQSNVAKTHFFES